MSGAEKAEQKMQKTPSHAHNRGSAHSQRRGLARFKPYDQAIIYDQGHGPVSKKLTPPAFFGALPLDNEHLHVNRFRKLAKLTNFQLLWIQIFYLTQLGLEL